MRLKSSTFSFIVITLFLTLYSTPIFADVDFRCIPIGGIECPPDDGAGGGGGGGGSSTASSSSIGTIGGPSCKEYTVPVITSNPLVEVTSIEPWTPNSEAPKEGDWIGYKIFVKNYEKLYSADVRVTATAIANGWPKKWESEVKSIGPGETTYFTNSFNIKFTNQSIPMLISLSYGDHVSYGKVYCGGQFIRNTWLVFDKIYKNLALQLGQATNVTSSNLEKTAKNISAKVISANRTNVKVGLLYTNIIVDLPFGSTKLVDIDSDGVDDAKIMVSKREEGWNGAEFNVGLELLNKTKEGAERAILPQTDSISQYQNRSVEIPDAEQVSEDNVPTGAIVLHEPEKKDHHFFAAFSNFLKKLLGGE